jgi:lactate permease
MRTASFVLMLPYVFMAASPLLLIVLLLLALRRPLFVAAPITLVYTALLARLVWAEELAYMLGASIKGVLIAVDILLIIFGAVFFLQFLRRSGLIHSLEYYLCSVSPDHRVQTILLAWFFLSFIEGMAGFGTPMAIVAPLLVALGFPALLAVTLALIAVGTAVAFGAVGTTIRVGLADLPTHSVAVYAAGINLVVGLFVPLVLTMVLVRYSGKHEPGAIREMVPFALFAGASLTVPYFLASFLGKEFPSLVGPVVGLVVVTYAAKKGWLIPRRVWRFGDGTEIQRESLGLGRTVAPFVLFIGLLLIGKFLLRHSWSISVAPDVTHKLMLFNPFMAFTLTVLLYTLFYNIPWSSLRESASTATKLLWRPTIVIFCISTFVQLMIFSGNNSSGLPGMLVMLTGWLATPLLPLISPFIGMLGAFISGSATVSNLLFANIQYQASQAVGINSQPILALQTVGAGYGNTIGLTDIVAVEATVGLRNEERSILKAVLLPCLFFLTLAGIMGLFIVYVL